MSSPHVHGTECLSPDGTRLTCDIEGAPYHYTRERALRPGATTMDDVGEGFGVRRFGLKGAPIEKLFWSEPEAHAYALERSASFEALAKADAKAARVAKKREKAEWGLIDAYDKARRRERK